MYNSEYNTSETLLTLTADIVTVHANKNDVQAGDLPALIASVHQALSGVGVP